MLDLEALSDALERHGRVARIVLAQTRGSAPREAGAAMLVWQDGQAGTIGGGRLELEATRAAQDMLASGAGAATRVTRQALGPALGQCCGGAITLVTELFDAPRYRSMARSFAFQGIWARRVEGEEVTGQDQGQGQGQGAVASADALPDAARRLIARHEDSDIPIPTSLIEGWLIEPVWQARLPVYIYGAGHVGRALARVLAPLRAVEVWLSDVREHQFDGLPDSIRQSWHVPPTEIMDSAPDDAAHVIMTPEHEYDLELCHRLLGRGFAWAGLIGSATKWARFRTRLKSLGHGEGIVDRITCPIGNPALGRAPQAIAIGVAAQILAETGAARKGATL